MAEPLQNHLEVTPLLVLPPETSVIPYISSSENQLPADHFFSQPNLAINGPETEEDDKKRDREHKKRSKNWTRVETLKLIKLRTELEPRFSRSGRKTELWDEIAESLHKEQFSRDAQQCRDKWEKLMAGFKDVREGLKDREDNPYYDDLHPLLSGKCLRREKDRDNFKKEMDFRNDNANSGPVENSGREMQKTIELEEEDDVVLEKSYLKKRKRGGKYASITDIAAVNTLLETVISRQQKFFQELLDSLERKEQIREQMRQDREEKWRAEERAQRNVFNNAMIILTQKLLGDKGTETTMINSTAVSASNGPRQGPKKRSKNWKRGEVLQLIKLRGEMDARFTNSARRATLWEELAETLERQGIKRDGKQCREKWDKLMAAYKDVIDGKREEGDLSYFAELEAIVGGKPDEGKQI
eukprot:Gb_00669 [translate_table: standard]